MIITHQNFSKTPSFTIFLVLKKSEQFSIPDKISLTQEEKIFADYLVQNSGDKKVNFGFFAEKSGKIKSIAVVLVSDDTNMRSLGCDVLSALAKLKDNKISLVASKSISAAELAMLCFAIRLSSYKFDKYAGVALKNRMKKNLATVEDIEVFETNTIEFNKEFDKLSAVAEGIEFARDLVSEPSNILYPESYAGIIKEKLTPLGVEVSILEEDKLKDLNMNLLLSVGQGSMKRSCVVIARWNGSSSNKDPIAFIGKGVTFDTGGISIKPSKSMEEMKYDMAGSAAAIGAVLSLAKRKAPVNAVAIIGLVENMPSGTAIKPGDVVKSAAGITVEIINTDAEGRLVLADLLNYTEKFIKPRFAVDLATLTGAAVVALGPKYAALMSDDDYLADAINQASKKTGDSVWRMPLPMEYDSMIDSKIADVQNVGSGAGAGTITAGLFLKRFVTDMHWAHLDIAGPAWSKKNSDCKPMGASGFGVALLDELCNIID